MIDWLVILSSIFVMCWLITVAIIYLWRPDWAVLTGYIGTTLEGEIDMWKTFMIAILVGLAVVTLFSLSVMIYVHNFYFDHPEALCEHQRDLGRGHGAKDSKTA
jgi:hypothetical protein